MNSKKTLIKNDYLIISLVIWSSCLARCKTWRLIISMISMIVFWWCKFLIEIKNLPLQLISEVLSIFIVINVISSKQKYEVWWDDKCSPYSLKSKRLLLIQLPDFKHNVKNKFGRFWNLKNEKYSKSNLR